MVILADPKLCAGPPSSEVLCMQSTPQRSDEQRAANAVLNGSHLSAEPMPYRGSYHGVNSYFEIIPTRQAR